MTVTDHPSLPAYRQGWLDAHAQIAAAIEAALQNIPVPRAPEPLKRCSQCGEPLGHGEAAEWVGRDAYMQGVFKHLGNCPRVRKLDGGPLYDRRPPEVPTIGR